MNKMTPLGIALVTGAIGLAGCADQPNYQAQSQYPSQQYPNQGYPSQGNRSDSGNVGTVDRIEVINRGDPNNIAGTVIGGVIGGLIGTQVGRGTTRSVATVAGAAGGAYVGNQFEQRQRASHESFRITVRMENGGFQTITADNVTDLRTGDRVRVDGNYISRY